jgi:hypothetical protein
VKQLNHGNWQNRTRLILTALPAASELCGTCAFWGGAREISHRGFIEIHPYSKGECRGNGFKHLEMAALATCGGWKPSLAFDHEEATSRGEGSLRKI